jgi:L-ascorbate peroxidase
VLDFNYGRADTQSCGAGAGRLPNAQLGIDNIREVFETQMGLTVEDGITLSGAHTLVHVHAEVSGYTGAAPAGQPPLAKINAWDNSPAVFDNHYWRRIQD